MNKVIQLLPNQLLAVVPQQAQAHLLQEVLQVQEVPQAGLLLPRQLLQNLNYSLHRTKRDVKLALHREK